MSRKILSPLFALLIFVAHLNCVVEHQLVGDPAALDSIANHESVKWPSGDQAPVDSDACEHGCICKGATLASGFVFTLFDVESFCSPFLAISPFCCVSQLPESGFGISTGKPVCCLSLRALDRCALLQTFLI